MSFLNDIAYKAVRNYYTEKIGDELMENIKKIIKNPYLISLITVISLSLIWYLHVILTELNDPFGLTFDYIIGVILPFILKIIVLFYLIILYLKIIPLLKNNIKITLAYFLFGFLFSLILIIFLSVFRNDIAHIFNNDVIKYYYYKKDGNYPVAMGDQIYCWTQEWEKGIIILKEVLFTFVIFLINSISILR